MMRERNVLCSSPVGLHHMAYIEWGDAENPRVLVCVHGLTRCARDFDFLAQSLENDYRVICPDVVGRGRSDWLTDKSLYGIPQYLADMVTLIARLDVERVDWLGTSMGGLIGMFLAAQANTPIQRLILNDVGPVVTAVSLKRIGEYVGRDPRFDTLEQAEQFVRAVSATFGPHDAAQWRHLTEHVVRQAADGKIEFRYDPGIAESYRQIAADGRDIELWPIYEQIHCPTLVVRGAESDLLRRETAAEMALRDPQTQVVEIPGVGHAPMFMHADQVALVRAYLLNTPP
ncbi:MAG: alpha/beta hydrolase [Sterolibacterium sp.]|jgi:pimeloyl-ACP methyl ester carboxylesterase|nr:alpha/beta hydrolase [Sterolibacterium sp.]